MKAPLLLVELCPVSTSDLQNGLASQPLTRRAVTLTVVLKEIISQTGWRHGGIND